MSERVFKSKWRKLKLIGIISFVAVAYGLAFLLFADGADTKFLVFFTLASLCLSLVAYAVILGQSDIIINEDGIAKSLFGIKWRFIGWNNVKVIMGLQVPAVGFQTKVLRAVVVVPIEKSARYWYMPKGIAFTEDYEDGAQLLDMIGRFAELHSIRIDGELSGITSKLSKG